MSNEFRQVDLIIGDVRRRRCTTERKLQIIEEAMPKGRVSSAARRHGVAPKLLYRWRRLLSEGGAVAVDSDEPVIGNSEVKKRKIAWASLSASSGARRWRTRFSVKPFPRPSQKTDIAADLVAEVRFPMKTVADILGVIRSNLAERLKGKSKPRGPCHSPTCGCSATYGYRRIAALLNRQRRAADLPVANCKRVHRIMANHAMILEKHTAVRIGRVHDGKVMVMRSNLRWCSDGLEFTCWNGEVVRLAFIIDAFDREIISWAAVANAGISGSDIRDMMLEAVENRFGTTGTPHAIEHLSDNGSAYTAKETRLFAQSLNLIPCFTPVTSPQSNGMSEAFVKTLKRDYIRISTIPDAETAFRKIDG
ncbi:IS3 family transposase [Rhizobium leguminosarum]|uniref:IS3 family transposase n=1 Tax=Rhizobium leguminosarum TaxID=384 RepID=UPI0021BBCD30|nr:IS3 family transposase [Rhizobium leguminosarum]